METKAYFIKSLQHIDNIIVQIKDSDWHNVTPCTEWNLHDLVNHMVVEVAWIPDLIDSKTISEVGNKYEGDLLEKDPLLAWSRYANKARTAVEKVDLSALVHLSYKDTTAGDYIGEVASDLLIHSWDVAKSINTNDKLPNDMVEQFYIDIKPHIPELQKMGIYHKSIKADKNASTQTKLLALLGRDVNWPRVDK